MLPYHRRLRAAEVADLIRSGRSLRGRYLSAKVAQNQDGTIRGACVVSKALAKTAPERNRLRRALYEAIAQATLPSSLSIVLFLRTIPEEPLIPAFRTDIESMFSGARS